MSLGVVWPILVQAALVAALVSVVLAVVADWLRREA
jgi:hypothetical protein